MSKDSDHPGSGFSLKVILQRHEEQLIDFDKSICLLCKRSFKNENHIRRHMSLSKLHSSRLKTLKERLFSEEQLERLERKEREALYRDRAKERRMKYGQADSIIIADQVHNTPTDKPKMSTPIIQGPAKPLGPDNKGAALLSKMGWREGSGLGKASDGITEIIKLDTQVGTSGLGSKSYKVDSNLSYKDAVKKIMYQRYHELSSGDEEST